MVALSFRADTQGPLLAPFAPTLEHYSALPTRPSYLRLLGLGGAWPAIVALATTVLAYPLAYFLRFQAGRRAGLLPDPPAAVPFWTSYLLRVMAWKLMLGRAASSTRCSRRPAHRRAARGAALQPAAVDHHPGLRLDPVRRAADPRGLQRIDSASTTPRRTCTPPGRQLPPGDAAAEHARRDRRLLHGLHPDCRRVRHAAPRRRYRRNDVRQHHPGLLHAGGQLAVRVGAGGRHVGSDARARGHRAPHR